MINIEKIKDLKVDIKINYDLSDIEGGGPNSINSDIRHIAFKLNEVIEALNILIQNQDTGCKNG
jgi:hypothetical protein